MAKKANPASADSKKKKKSKKGKKSAPNSVAMKLKAPKDNPFETIWSRRKFDIIGKKRKGEERRIGLARSNAIEKRKSTLLKEYKQSGKSSLFVDKRIGEQNDELEEFDKAIMRSQRERQLKLKKKSKYNLSDGEEDDLEIQGLGSFLGRDDFEDELLPDDDYVTEEAENEKNSANLRRSSDYNAQEVSMEGKDQKRKSKKEVMKEVIAKHKFFKAQKAQYKEEDEHLFQQLDKDFALLMQTSGNALPAMPKIDSSKQRQLHPYDKIVKEMALEMRARPSDRTKTPEEIAQEERERLERLEEERQKRMVATDDSTDEDADSLDLHEGSTEKLKSVSGDDLSDSFLIDGESKTKKGWVDDIFERDAAIELNHEDSESSEDSESAEDDGGGEESNKDNDDSEKTPSFKDWEQSDDENFSTDLEDGDDDNDSASDEDEDEDEDKRMELEGKKKAKRNDALSVKKITNVQQPPTKNDSLPFIIEAPNDFGELCRLFENISNADIVVAVTRIRKTNPIVLKEDNRRKIQGFYGLLLQYFAVLADKKPLNFELLNLLVKPLMEMSMEIPYYAAICARNRISHTRKQFCEAIKMPGKSCWPSLKTLLLFRLWSMIYPCSDFHHVVMTPVLLLMCEYLMRCPILCGRDIAIGSFLCSMVLSVVKQSRKFCPEAIMFLQTSLVAALGRKPESCQVSQLHSVIPIKDSSPLLSLEGSVDAASLDFFKLMEVQDNSPFFGSDSFRAGVLVSVIETLRGFVNAYEEFKSFPEIFLPISALLLEVAEQKYMPAALQDKLKDVAQLINKKADEHHILRRPLQMRKQKPVPIRLLNPKFEENFIKGRDYDPDRERAEQRKLKKLIKQEAKGAIRELRKDNYFLFEAKEKDKALQEEERADKYRKAMAFLQDQEHQCKSGQLGKGRKRRR